MDNCVRFWELETWAQQPDEPPPEPEPAPRPAGLIFEGSRGGVSPVHAEGRLYGAAALPQTGPAAHTDYVSGVAFGGRECWVSAALDGALRVSRLRMRSSSA